MSEMSGDLDRAAIVALIDQEVRAAGHGDMDVYEAALADDAVFMPPNGPARHGKELRSWLREFLEGFAVEWLSFEHEETVVEGNLGYHTYRYEWKLTPRAGGEPTLGHGKGVHIVRREADGAWRIVREIWNATPAPESATDWR